MDECVWKKLCDNRAIVLCPYLHVDIAGQADGFYVKGDRNFKVVNTRGVRHGGLKVLSSSVWNKMVAGVCIRRARAMRGGAGMGAGRGGRGAESKSVTERDQRRPRDQSKSGTKIRIKGVARIGIRIINEMRIGNKEWDQK
ncbi:hypothetical protein EVAR_28980_1 [Eumeta japonica]|uniref:Uncharacterized protein n=1 Tax=Eumeta variegata TaxID=151549 RepID=A0A4C1W3W2_EUMVA|nr:hypothetical protein EVAR_28980_1 [Eumeta japonica]